MKNKVFAILLTLMGFVIAFDVNASNESLNPIFKSGEITDYEVKNWVTNIQTESGVEGFRLSWDLDEKESQVLANQGLNFLIKYRFESDASSNEGESYEWNYVKDIATSKSGIFVSDLKGEETFVVKLGLTDGEQEFWFKEETVTTLPSWGIFNFLTLIGSLAMFLYGMKIMSDGLQQAAGTRLRSLLTSITSNSFKGILTGLGITALVQSSSVTTVMVVSFVNAGILTLTQSAGVVMGANIGTTITAWIIDFFGFKVDIGAYTLVMLAVGLPLLFLRSTKSKGWANAIIGFSFLFMGLGFLKESVPVLGPESALVQSMISLNTIPYFSSIIFLFIGALLTIIIQSSSATMALTMTLMASGVIPFEVGAAMVLGENIGTTVTATLAASIGNVHAKRTARIHTAFNIIGVTWVLLIFPFFLKLVSFITEWMAGGNPMVNPEKYGSTGLAVLHTVFNVSNVLILVWFIPSLVKLAEKTVKPKGLKDEQFHLDLIGTKIMTTPSLYVSEVKKEIAKFGEVTSRMSKFTRELLFENNKKTQRDLLKRIKKYEEITDKVEVEIANYLNNVATGNITKELAIRFRGMNSIVSNLERIGDIFYSISLSIEKKIESKYEFTPEQYKHLDELFELIDHAFTIMYDNLKKPIAEVTLTEANKAEDAVNKKRDEIKEDYLSSLYVGGELNMQSAIIYSNIYESLERVGDHIINVSEDIMGKV